MQTIYRALIPALTLVSSGVRAVPLEHTEVAPGIHVFTTAPDGYVQNGNSLVIIDPDGVLIFDTFTRPSTAKTLVAEIRKLTKAPVRTIVNSHWHPDHWFGNQALLEAFPGAEVVTSEETRRLLLTTEGTWKPRFEAELRKNPADSLGRDFMREALTVTFRPPTITYGDQLVLHRGGREIRLISMVGDAQGRPCSTSRRCDSWRPETCSRVRCLTSRRPWGSTPAASVPSVRSSRRSSSRDTGR